MNPLPEHEKNIASPVCRRCGQCCRKGGPALHREDLPLVRSGAVPRERLLTLRAGEMVHENVVGGLVQLEVEIVRLAGDGSSSACPFHDAPAQACLIHGSRPAECRALFCEDTSAVEAMYRVERLTRADILDPRGALWELVAFHESAFPAAGAVDLARRAASGRTGAAESLAELVRAEENFRRTFRERTGISSGELDLYFGRSLARVCAQFGRHARG